MGIENFSFIRKGIFNLNILIMSHKLEEMLALMEIFWNFPEYSVFPRLSRKPFMAREKLQKLKSFGQGIRNENFPITFRNFSASAICRFDTIEAIYCQSRTIEAYFNLCEATKKLRSIVVFQSSTIAWLYINSFGYN